MNNRIVLRAAYVMAGMAMMVNSAMSVAAQDSPIPPTAPAATETAPTKQTSPVQLSYGVPDVLKLVRAKVGDETIVAFVANSGRMYNLSAPEIVYLREQGASDRVITAMLDQRKKLMEIAKQSALQTPAAPAAPTPSQPEAATTATTAPPAPTYVQSPPTYVQSTPVYVPSPTTYVVPYQPYSYYGSGPYYGGYYGYPYSPLSLSFGFGFGNYGHYGGYGHYGHHH